MFRCEPCREIIQFFEVWRDRDANLGDIKPRDIERWIDQVRAA